MNGGPSGRGPDSPMPPRKAGAQGMASGSQRGAQGAAEGGAQGGAEGGAQGGTQSDTRGSIYIGNVGRADRPGALPGSSRQTDGARAPTYEPQYCTSEFVTVDQNGQGVVIPLDDPDPPPSPLVQRMCVDSLMRVWLRVHHGKATQAQPSPAERGSISKVAGFGGGHGSASCDGEECSLALAVIDTGNMQSECSHQPINH